ncbi:MAG: hypothetical protein EWM72_00159 [Nitrospira sp.]|nr:MAG: hypothetical protein EWM72_00159 [Nitrospira sp.]
MATTRIFILDDKVDTRFLLSLRRHYSQAAVGVPFRKNSHRCQAA